MAPAKITLPELGSQIPIPRLYIPHVVLFYFNALPMPTVKEVGSLDITWDNVDNGGECQVYAVVVMAVAFF